jgi:hypothetical protein
VSSLAQNSARDIFARAPQLFSRPQILYLPTELLLVGAAPFRLDSPASGLLLEVDSGLASPGALTVAPPARACRVRRAVTLATPAANLVWELFALDSLGKTPSDIQLACPLKPTRLSGE